MTSRNTTTNPAINRASLSPEINSLASLMANSTRVVVPQAPQKAGDNQEGSTNVYQSVQFLSDRDLTSMVNGNLLDVALNASDQSFTAKRAGNSLSSSIVNVGPQATPTLGAFAAFETAMSTRPAIWVGNYLYSEDNGPWQLTDGTAGAPAASDTYGGSNGSAPAANIPYDMDNGSTATSMSIHLPTPVDASTGLILQLLQSGVNGNGLGDPYGPIDRMTLTAVFTSAAQVIQFQPIFTQTWNGSGNEAVKTPNTEAQGLFGPPAVPGWAPGGGSQNDDSRNVNSTMVGCMVKLFSLTDNAAETRPQGHVNFHIGPDITDELLPPGTPCMITVVTNGTLANPSPINPPSNTPQTLTIVNIDGTAITARSPASAVETLYTIVLQLGRRTTWGGVGVAGSEYAPQIISLQSGLTPTLPNATLNDFFEYFGVGVDTKSNAYSLHDALFGNSYDRSTDKSCILRMQDYSKSSHIDMFMGTVTVTGTPNTGAIEPKSGLGALLTKTPVNTPAAEHVRFARAGWGPQASGDTALDNSSALANAAVKSSTRTYFALSKARLTVILAKWSGGTDEFMTFVLCGDVSEQSEIR